MRPLWSGSISFGLVSIPVRMYSATSPHQGIDLDMLHKTDRAPIRYARMCTKDGEEVPWDDIVKGYEYQEGDYVVLTPKDIDELDAKKTQTINILQFVDTNDIDIRYFEKPYYLEVQKGGEKAYALLRAALHKSNKLALAKFAMHEHEHIAAIKPSGRVLVLNQMRYPTDLREAADLDIPSDKDLTEKEIDMALKFIKQETRPFIAEDLRDTYTEELEALIKQKAKGKTHTSKPKQPAAASNAKDLMDALKASLKE
ncbi:MAG TPA: Ku protein [Candidatus Saccharimonadales bacterium]|nr:Ku protein [Candidatus Saccharimonadales bacterium]